MLSLVSLLTLSCFIPKSLEGYTLVGLYLSLTINILGTEVNSFLWLGCCASILVSAIAYGYFISRNKLTIRDKGVVGISEIYWHQVVDYSFLEKERYSYLIIKHLNGFKREIETKYRIGLLEKERVKQIFQGKPNK